MVTSYPASRQCRMHDPSRACPQRNVRHPATFCKEEQVAGLVSLTVRRYRDLAPLSELLVAVTLQFDPPCAAHRLHQTGAIDPPLGAAAPEIRRTRIPFLRELGQRQVPCLDTQLLLAAHVSRRDRAALTISQLHHSPAERHAGSGRQPAAPLRRQNIGAERSRGRALLPV